MLSLQGLLVPGSKGQQKKAKERRYELSDWFLNG